MRAIRGFRSVTRCTSTVLVLSAVVFVSGCGGSRNASGPEPSATPSDGNCSLESEKAALRDYMQEAYFWTGLSPNPAPAGFTSLESYFDALLFAGSSTLPADRWSYVSDTATYDLFFEEGKTLGYGVSVNGLERQTPLRIRYVEPDSPAAKMGLQRGDVILAINGVSDGVLLATGNFGALSPSREGDTVAITIQETSGARVVNVSAATYDLKPVAASTVLTMGNGGKVGYVSLKDFVTQAEAPLTVAIDTIRSAGAKDIIVDLRYNGGGRISTATALGSLIAGQQNNGKVFTSLIYNVKQSAFNFDYRFSAASEGFSRAVVLTGQRTCSASELLANGLKPYMQVITIGASTCGKPYGFSPVDSCGKTYSAVNFESVNADGVGRYYDGLKPTCSVAETFTGALGAPDEVLTAAATGYLQTGVCPVAFAEPRILATRRPFAGTVIEPGEFRGMRAD
jgi:carboxyl-terminal processing protease